MKTCFSIMPFDPVFEDIDRIIEAAATECGMTCVRGDRRDQPGIVLAQIVHDLKAASVIVADISGHNPNVFYELGIAHQLHGPERVVILTQQVDGEMAYDVHQFRQLVYSHNESGRARLRQELPERLRKAAEWHGDEELWNVIRGKLPRTRLIVRDLDRLLQRAGDGRIDGLTLRVMAGLSSLAISDHEPEDPALGKEYIEQLLAERNLMRTLLARGAKLKAILNPPRRFAAQLIPQHWHPTG